MLKLSINSQNISHFLETKVFFFFIIFFCLAFQAISYLTLWTETEIYPTHSSKYLFSHYTYEFLFALKPLFYSVLKLSFVFSSLFDWLPMTSARFLFALNGLSTLLFMYFYIKNKSNKYNAILAVLLLASANIFLDRGFRVRSDLLSTSCSLICLLINLNIKGQKDFWKYYIMLPLLFSILLISPKGIYWLFFTSLLLWHDNSVKPDRQLLVKIGALICFTCILLSYIFKDPFFLTSIHQSFKFYTLTLSQTYSFILKEGWIKNLYEFSHVFLFASRNHFVLLIIILKFLFMIQALIFSKKRKRDLSDLYFLTLSVVMLIHPQQTLFFLASLTPFFCISFFTDQNWTYCIKQAYSKNFKLFLLMGAFIYSFSYVSYFKYKVYTKKNNSEQKTLLKGLNHFYKNTHPLINIFDPNCLIYSRKTNCEYILYNRNFQNNFNSYIQNKNFDIILAVSQLRFFNLTSDKEARFKFVNIRNAVYYQAFIISAIDESASYSNKQGFLSGKKIMEDFERVAQTNIPESARQYFYLQIDNLNQPLHKIQKCKKKSFPVLEEGCYYSKDQFINSLIPFENNQLALFYSPFPFDLQSEKSLRILFQYDKFN